MDERILLYLLTLGIHVPWLIYAWRTGKILKYPIISFCYLGMFLFNALGSIFVAYPELVDKGNYYSAEFFALVNVQAVIFYLVTAVYFLFSRPAPMRVMPEPTTADRCFPYLLLVITLAIVAHYCVNVGSPPLLGLLSGSLNGQELVGYRIENTYGREDYFFYHLGYTILPVIAGVQVFVISLVQPKGRLVSRSFILVCIFISCLVGGKGNVLEIITALTISYLLYCAGYTRAGPQPIAYKKILLVLGIGLVPVAAMFYVYCGEVMDNMQIFVVAIYRVFDAYAEALAGVVLYTREYGFVGIQGLPNVHGLLGHETLHMEEEMCSFLNGVAGGGVSIPGPAQGYLAFGWPGFVSLAVICFSTMVLIQEVFRRISLSNPMVFSLLITYVWLATKVAQIGFFYTFASFTLTIVFALLLGARFGLDTVRQPVMPNRTLGLRSRSGL